MTKSEDRKVPNHFWPANMAVQRVPAYIYFARIEASVGNLRPKASPSPASRGLSEGHPYSLSTPMRSRAIDAHSSAHVRRLSSRWQASEFSSEGICQHFRQRRACPSLELLPRRSVAVALIRGMIRAISIDLADSPIFLSRHHLARNAPAAAPSPAEALFHDQRAPGSSFASWRDHPFGLVPGPPPLPDPESLFESLLRTLSRRTPLAKRPHKYPGNPTGLGGELVQSLRGVQLPNPW